MSHIEQYFEDAITILEQIDKGQIEKMIEILLNVRKHHGRLFMLGVGGSAGNCIHAVNDFRKLAGIETYSPAENIAEITARTNDEGWETVFSEWLKCSYPNINPTQFLPLQYSFLLLIPPLHALVHYLEFLPLHHKDAIPS